MTVRTVMTMLIQCIGAAESARCVRLGLAAAWSRTQDSESARLRWPAISRRRYLPVRRRVLFALPLLLPLAAHAQSVRGVVVDAVDRPVPGVVVLLLDSVS